MKKAVLGTILAFLLTGVAWGQPPDWIKTTLNFPIEFTAPLYKCNSTIPLTDLDRALVYRTVDGGTPQLIATVNPIVPGMTYSVDQTAEGETEDIKFSFEALDTVGNSSKDCGPCETTRGSIRLGVGCGTIRVP